MWEYDIFQLLISSVLKKEDISLLKLINKYNFINNLFS